MIRFIFNELPGHGQINILIARADKLEHAGKRLAVRQVFHLRFHFGRQRGRQRKNGLIHVFLCPRLRHNAVKIFADHGDRAAQKVAKVVGQVCIDAVD